MRLNLKDEKATAELLAESLRRTGAAVLGVNGNSMHPTLQMGWRVHLKPATGADLRIGQLAVFTGARHLTVHRLIWRESWRSGGRLVFRGDYNRLRERIPPEAVIGRVVAIEIPGQRPGQERIVVLAPDPLTWFYRVIYGLAAPIRPILSRSGADGRAPGPLGRAARNAFAAIERIVSTFLRERR